MPSLKSGNEVKPSASNLLSPDYRPAGSFDHEVSDGENWQKLADRYRIPAKSIVESNFKTSNPYEINWYLREYVNCKVPTPDGYNWRFSTSARDGGIPGRAGKVFILPNWVEIEKAAKSLTKRYVKQWFDMCSITMGIVDGARLMIGAGMVRPNMAINQGFSMELELAGAPRQVAQGWGAHLQHGLESFTMGLRADEANAFPIFSNWQISGSVPLMLALPWALLRSNESAIASQNWFTAQLMFPGLSHPELQGVIKRHGLWFANSFHHLRMATIARQVMGHGVADQYRHHVTGIAFATPHFLQTPDMMD